MSSGLYWNGKKPRMLHSRQRYLSYVAGSARENADEFPKLAKKGLRVDLYRLPTRLGDVFKNEAFLARCSMPVVPPTKSSPHARRDWLYESSNISAERLFSTRP